MKVDPMLLKRIHESISTNATGTPECLAKKMDISKRVLLEILKQMKEEFDAPIMYSRPRETYYYTEDCEFYFGIVKSKKAFLIKSLTEAIYNATLDIINKIIVCNVILAFTCFI